jgi:hypothetical protein
MAASGRSDAFALCGEGLVGERGMTVSNGRIARLQGSSREQPERVPKQPFNSERNRLDRPKQTIGGALLSGIRLPRSGSAFTVS